MSEHALFSLRQLIRLAGDERDLLAAGDWETALPVREEFDEQFAQLQSHIRREPLGPEHSNLLAQLTHLHRGNIDLALGLQREAGAQLKSTSNISKLGGYAPLGSDHRPSPRYLDHSA